MGLDMVELHMAIEDHFGIRLPANEIFPQTVGDVFNAIKRQLERAAECLQNRACPCIPVFFEVRDVLMQLGRSTRRVRPSTRLEDALPRRRLLAAWGTLEATLCTKLPKLGPPQASGAVFIAWLGIVVLAELFSFLAFDVAGLILATVLFVPFITWFAVLIDQQLPRPFPPGISTVRDLVRVVIPATAWKTAPRAERQLWDRLVAIASDQLDVPRELIRPESHFVRDLRCG